MFSSNWHAIQGNNIGMLAISGLGVARCPADKAAILVAAHRIIVGEF